LEQLIHRNEEGGTIQLMRMIRETTLARNFGRDGPMGMDIRMLGGLLASTSFLRDLADTWTLRGVLALEYGDAAKAEEYFSRGLRLVKTPVMETAFVGAYGIRSPLEAAAFLAARTALPEPRATFPQQSIADRYRGLLLRSKEQAGKNVP